ncbi:MAG: response regulator [Magnetococcales bacterium]|nr:response regulator [Magnetococcales bacterium]
MTLMNATAKQTKATILVVDDQPINIEILNGILQDHYRVLFATNGLDALEAVEEQRPDLILLDVVMPGVDGYQVCSILQSDPVTQEIPVLFITSMGDPKYESVGMRMGAVDYIIKPIEAGIVLEKVRYHLEKTAVK